jgi:alpha-glucosidase
MFTDMLHLHYQGRQGQEFIWRSGSDSSSSCLFAGIVLSDDLVRIRCIRGAVVDEARYCLVDNLPGTLPYHSWSVARGDEAWPDVPLTEEQARARLEPYVSGFSLSATAIRLSRPLAALERIYGLGERTGSMNKRGQTIEVWNIDPPQQHSSRTEAMYTSIPFYLALDLEQGRSSGTLIDHAGRVTLDLGQTNQAEAAITLAGDSLVAYFFAGPTPADVLRQYTELTGHLPLPPRWALGYHQCRWGYESEAQVREVVARLRTGRHPCDTIWLDIDYMNVFRDFTWDKQQFPQFQQMISDFHDQGLHVVTIVDPGIKIDEDYPVYQQGAANDYFCLAQNGEVFTGKVWPGLCAFPDFSRTDVRNWWSTLLEQWLSNGIDGIWNDMNEPALLRPVGEPPATPPRALTMSEEVLHRAGGAEPTGPDGPPVSHALFHNAYGQQMARTAYEAQQHLHPDRRPFSLTRAGTAGVQRYAAVWTGDNSSLWEHIPLAITMCLNLNMSGVAFVGVDLGGFWGESSGELLVRFTQLGALLPFCRNHNAKGDHAQEPWAFGEPFESAHRQAIEQRYRLLPYLYTLFHEAATTGTPIIRPLYYHYGQDREAVAVEDAFLLGDALLSAPIYKPGASSRQVYLPAGTWFDFWDGTPYNGSNWQKIAAPLERWPLLVRANSIVPSGPVMQHTGERPTDPLTFTCFLTTGGQSSITLYEDDGTTLAYQRGNFALTTIHCQADSTQVIVEIEEQHKNYRPERQWYQIVVLLNGQRLTQRVQAGQGKIISNLP